MRLRLLTLTLLSFCLTGLLPAHALENDESIWPRLVMRMQLVNNQQREIIDWARRYSRHPRNVETMLARAEPYLWDIVQICERYRMPAEVALLPAIESGFNPHAQSPYKANGLWQFIPMTGRTMGLPMNAQYDARRDTVASTTAAMRYLRRLHGMFGDWNIALAAYNIGEGGMQRYMAKQPGVTDFWALELPRETFEQVRRLMAIALIVEKPHRFNVKLPRIADRPLTEKITLTGPTNLALAAHDARVPEQTIRTYNPGLVTLANSTAKQVLLLPPAQAQRMRTALKQKRYPPGRAPGAIVKTAARTNARVHIIKRGDSLWTIARQHRVTVEALRRHNNLKKTAVLHPGKTLQIPPVGTRS